MTSETETIARALSRAAGALAGVSPTPRLDAELLLAHVLGWSRARLLAEGRAPLDIVQQAAFEALVARRQALEPVAYLTGYKEFFGLDFEVSPAVLVPRPETELLVELALRFARPPTTDHRPLTTDAQELPLHASQTPVVGRRSSVVMADIGTGSGAIAVALATQLPDALVYAVDLSPEALEVAGRNAARHGVAGRVRLLQGDLLAPLPEPVDLLVSNPPYTVLSEIDENVRRHEPHLALDGGPDGLVIYRRLLAQAPALLRPSGVVLLEIGATQGQAVAALAREHFPAARVSLHQDLAGLDRVVVIVTR